MSNEIWVFVEQREGKVRKVTLELLSAGADFSKKTSSQLAAILLGSGLQEAVKSLTPFADKIYLIDDPSLASYTSEAYLIDMAPLIKQHQPSALLGGATSTGKDLFPRLAMHLQTGYAPDCMGLAVEENACGISITRKGASTMPDQKRSVSTPARRIILSGWVAWISATPRTRSSTRVPRWWCQRVIAQAAGRDVPR